ncbi:hypothetical protein AAFC00_003078 [Neodothiora populina]|uniref:Aminotransferase n=1 Tax=Neodothiora populina TaxID=2781224 RepID=A0ABR3P9B5_9PEZI
MALPSTSTQPATTTSSILHRSLHTDPHSVITAKDNYLTLSNGQRILDATGGAAVTCLGHGNTRVRDAVMKQMDEGVAYCHSLFFATAAAEELASELIEETGGVMERVFVVSSGSEAVEAALKLARQYFLEIRPAQPQRTKFISRLQSYHGTTLGALGAGGHLARREAFEPLLIRTTGRVSPCNAYRDMRDGESTDEYVARLAKELDDEFVRLGPETVCAFIAEPVVGAALGCVPPIPGYFPAMKAVCEKHGALLILDEVMSGMGRTGYLHAWQNPLVGVTPDVQTIGKALGSGYMPIAAMLVNRRVVATMRAGSGAFMHGQTYQGHPVACAAALEVSKIIKEDKLVQNCAEMGELLGQLLKEKVLGLEGVGDVRGAGLFWGIEFVKNKQTKEPFDPSEGIAMGVHQLAIQPPFNISIYPGTGTVDGKRGDHVLIAPAYNVTPGFVVLIVNTVAQVISKFFEMKKGQ